MDLRHNITIFSLLVVLFFGTSPLVFAQAQEPLQYLITPDSPGPNQVVLVEVQGVGSFLGDAKVSWTLDGSLKKSGVGERSFTFTTGALGSRSTLKVDIDSPTQGFFTKTFVFSPSLVNMIWEANTTVPPLYRGKALYSAGSPLKVVAFPSVYSGSSRIAASALSYQWSRNDTPVPEASGLGRFAYSFDGDQLQPQEQVAVDVFYGNSKVAHGEVTIPAVDPKILFYEYSALRGPLYDIAVPEGILLSASEITLKAEPYYFSRLSQLQGTLSYTWSLDGEVTTGPDASRGILTLRQSGEGSGSAVLTAALQNISSDQFVQSAQSALQIVFGQQNNSSFFGL